MISYITYFSHAETRPFPGCATAGVTALAQNSVRHPPVSAFSAHGGGPKPGEYRTEGFIPGGRARRRPRRIPGERGTRGRAAQGARPVGRPGAGGIPGYGAGAMARAMIVSIFGLPRK